VADVVDAVDRVCPTCGAPLPRKFCADCGEKRITAHDYSLVHFGEALVENLTHFDVRSFRALWYLVAKPGRLTRDYLDGRRRRYIGPIQLFVILNVVFALTGGNTFRTPLSVQEHDWPAAALKRGMVAQAIEKSGVTREEFTRQFDQNAGVQAKTWIFSMIPAFAICMAALYGFRRYFFEHLVFSTHFYTVFLVTIVVVGFLFWQTLKLAGIHLTGQGFDEKVSLTIVGVLIVHTYFALRRAYEDRPIAAMLRAIAAGALVTPVLFGYRFLLFFVTLKTLH